MKGRGALVLGLWAAFWLLSLGLAAALFAVPVVQARYAQRRTWSRS